MKQYKGYFVDHVIFNSTEEIDEFIKSETIKKYQQFCKMFAEDACMEMITMMHTYEERLHNEFGLGWDEIEQLEVEAIAA